MSASSLNLSRAGQSQCRRAMSNEEAESEPGEESRDVTAEVAEEYRRYRERLDEIPKTEHSLYGSLLAPEYSDQLFPLLGQFGALNIGAWRGQASAGWKIDSSLARRYKQRAWL